LVTRRSRSSRPFVLRECVVGDELQVRAAEDRDAAAFQVLDRLDAGIGRHRDLDARADAGGEQQMRLEPVGAREHGGQVALVREVERLVGDRFVDGRPGALEEQPLHLDAVGREFLLDELLQLHGRGGRAAEGRRIAGTLLRDADADDGGFVRVRGGGRQREDGGDQQRSQQTQWKHGSIEVETSGERSGREPVESFSMTLPARTNNDLNYAYRVDAEIKDGGGEARCVRARCRR